MNKTQSLEVTNDAFSCRTRGSVAILKLGPRAFDIATNLGLKGQLQSLLSRIEQSTDMKVLVVINSTDYAGCRAYSEFLRQVGGHGSEGDTDWQPLLLKEENALRQFAIQVASFQKVTVAALQGDITTSFFGTCLAFDYRYGAKDARIVFPDPDIALPPVGALGFYLPRYVGQSTASDLLLSGKPISVRRAWKLGLVNEILGINTLEQSVLEKCEALCHQSAFAIKGIKELIHTEVTELEQYMEHSQRIITRWARSHSIEANE